MFSGGSKGNIGKKRIKIAKGLLKINQDIVSDQDIIDDGVLAVSDEDKKIAWRSYHKKLLNTEFAWDMNSLFQGYTVTGVSRLINKVMVRESMSKMKNGIAAGPSGILSEVVKAVEEAGVDMITDLVNQIMVEGVFPAEWELSTIVNFYKGKEDDLERGNYRGLKLTDQILKYLREVYKTTGGHC